LASGLSHDIDNLSYTFSVNINSIDEKLNRGFKQKICIARALYFKPKLLIIDEGTSSLDPKNENTIIKSLKKYESSSTIIVVTHRLSSIESANRVFYLKNGQLLGEGKFSELQRIVPEFGLQVTSMKIE
jgi:ABC-type bacteriocin/lantibiotic exporter with double-glycine peptidase domain